MWRTAGYTAGLVGRRVVLIDHRGHGASGRPTERAQHGIDRYVEDVLAVADALGERRFCFFGYSAGASVGYRLAARHPERVVGLVGLGAVGGPERADDDDLEIDRTDRTEGSDALVTWLRKKTRPSQWFADSMRSTSPEMFALLLEAWTLWGGPWEEFAKVGADPPRRRAAEEGANDDAAHTARRATETSPPTGVPSSSPSSDMSWRSCGRTSYFPTSAGSSTTSHRRHRVPAERGPARRERSTRGSLPRWRSVGMTP